MTRQLSGQRGVFAGEDLSDRSGSGDQAENLAAAQQRNGQQGSRFVGIRPCEIAKKRRGRADRFHLPLAHHVHERFRDFSDDRIDRARQLGIPRGVAMRHSDAAQCAVGIVEIDRADFREVRHEQLGQRGHRMRQVER